MSKGILWTIKIGAIFFAILLMVIAKKIGVPIIVANIIGFGIVYAVWKYKLEEPKNDSNNNQQLDKS